MNNFEIANWPHIVRKGKSMLGRAYLIAVELTNRKHPQHRKGSLEDHYEVAKRLPLSERYIRGSLKRILTAPTAYLRSLKDKVRNKIEQKDKTPRYFQGVRKKKRNGK